MIPFARSLSNFAGAYFNQADNDTLTIMLTSAEGADAILELAPARPYSVQVQLAEHTYSELAQAVAKSREVWAESVPGIELLAVLSTHAAISFVRKWTENTSLQRQLAPIES